MDKKPSIISYVSRGDACFWYRNKMPLEALARKGWKTSTLNMGDLMNLENVDVVQFSRVYTTQFEEFVFMLKSRGIKIWYDVDDAVDLVKPWNPFALPNKKHMSAFYFMLNEADFITTTNQNLADHLSKKTPKPVHVFPNFVNLSEWKERPKAKDTSTFGPDFRIGFCGSPSHIKEVNMILPVIRDLQARYHFTFVMWGMGNGNSIHEWYSQSKVQYAAMWDTWEYTKEMDKMYELMKEINHEWVSACRWEMYPRKLAKLDLDIGICPLDDDDFNRSKTPIKLYEYALAGTMTVASNITPFKEEALVLAENTYESWYETLDSAIMHADLRKTALEKQQEWVKGHKTIDENINILQNIILEYVGKKTG